MSIDLKNLTIKEARKALDSGEYSSVDLTKAYLENIEKRAEDLNALREVFDDALEQAAEADKRIQAGKAEILTGIPVILKDNTLIKGRKSGSASKILEGHVATYDSFVAQKLKEQGVVFVGRANMDEFAMGGSTENSGYGPAKNPIDETRVPGGSSGGSAIAVAADFSLVSLGSDTGGSIRQPASLCGIVGMKPTYGAVSRSGLMALGSSLDQIGPFGKTVEDAEILFNAIKGNDPMDMTTIPNEWWDENTQVKKQMTVGVPRNLFESGGMDPDVLENFEDSLKKLEKAGYAIKDIEIEDIEYSLAVYYIIMPAEASSNLSRFDGVKYGLHVEGKDLLDDYKKTRGQGFGKEVRRRIVLGTYVLSAGYYDAYYNKAVAVRRKITQGFEKAFKEVDVIATPTSPVPAFKIGEKTDDPVAMYLADIFTVPANIANIPGISVPSGVVVREGKELPVGIQFMTPQLREVDLFKVGKDFEKAS